MTRTLVIFLFLVGSISLPSLAQNQVGLDSLIWSLDNAKSDTTKVRLCMDISNRYIRA